MKEITSVSNTYIKDLAKLKEKKYLEKSDCFIVEGAHLVEEAYRHGCLKQVLTTDEELFVSDVDNIKVTSEIIKKLTGTVNPQNIIGLVSKFNNKIDIKNSTSILVLDGVSDPGNVGTIIRTAAGFGIDAIVMSEDCVDLYNEKVVRSTQGAIFVMNIIKTNLNDFLPLIKKEGFYVYGTSLNKSVDLNSVSKNKKYAIVLGNEARGVKNEVLEMCDTNIKINITNKVESLNVAIAGAILMHYFTN